MIPVFAFPDCLVFSEKQSLQTLSLYNPYDFKLKFSILSTNPNKFNVSNSEGILRARHSIDILIRIRDLNLQNSRFLITITEYSSSKPRSGERQIECHFKSDEEREEPKKPKFEPCIGQSSCAESQQMAPKDNNKTFQIVLAICLLLVLLLPHDSGNWFSLTVTHKLVVSYVLGLLTVFILRN